MEESMANLGYVNLGEMSGGMVKRLLTAGHGVTGYDRTRSKTQPLLELSLQQADSPRAVPAILNSRVKPTKRLSDQPTTFKGESL
jgi:6-phosphogluconate dehydrogenase (decarboxylating)